MLGFYGSKQTECEGITRGQGLFTNSHKSLVTCAIIIIYLTWLILLCYYCKHICTSGSVNSNFNFIYKRLCIKSVLQCGNVVDCKLRKICRERIMRHILSCNPQGGKISQSNPTCCINKTILRGISIDICTVMYHMPYFVLYIFDTVIDKGCMQTK